MKAFGGRFRRPGAPQRLARPWVQRLVLPVAAGLPFGATAVAALADRNHVYNSTDLASMDLQVHQALSFHALVGVYDRFGWHHPGPFYVYLISFVERVFGRTSGLQAEIATAALISGVCVGGIVFTLGYLQGRRGELVGLIAAVAGVVILVRATPFWLAWTPDVVILPVALVGVLCVAGCLGGGRALAAAVLVSTFAVQTDVATLPVCAVFLLFGTIFYFRRHDRRRGSPRTSTKVLFGVTALAWFPPLYQELTSSSGNLSAILSFFTAQHHHAGITSGSALAGLGEGYSVGFPNYVGTSGPGHVLALLALLVPAVVVVLARRSHNRPAFLLGGAGLMGSLVALAAGADVVGQPYPYLDRWAGGVAIVSLLGLGLVVAGGLERLQYRRWMPLLPATGLAGLISWAAVQPGPSSYSDSQVGAVTTAVIRNATPQLRIGFREIGQYYTELMGGVMDEFEDRNVRFTIGPTRTHVLTGSEASPSREWFALVVPKWTVPPGFDRVAKVDHITIAKRVTSTPMTGITRRQSS